MTTERLSREEYDALDKWFYDIAPRLYHAVFEGMASFNLKLPKRLLYLRSVFDCMNNEAESIHHFVSDAVYNALNWAADVDDAGGWDSEMGWSNNLTDTIWANPGLFPLDKEHHTDAFRRKNLPVIVERVRSDLVKHRETIVDALEKNLDEYFAYIQKTQQWVN